MEAGERDFAMLTAVFRIKNVNIIKLSAKDFAPIIGEAGKIKPKLQEVVKDVFLTGKEYYPISP